MNIKLLFTTLLILAFSPALAIAQDGWSNWNSGVQNNLIQGMIWDALRNNVNSQQTNDYPLDILALATIPSNFSQANFEFQPNLQVRQAAINEFVAEATETYPNLAANTAFNQLEVFAIASHSLGKYGLSTSNFADTMTNYLITLHRAANAQNAEPTPETTAAVRRQVINIIGQFATKQDFEDPTDMQYASDDLLLRSVLINTLNSTAIESGNRQFNQDIALMTQQTFGVNFSQLSLDARGLTKKS